MEGERNRKQRVAKGGEQKRQIQSELYLIGGLIL